MTLLDLLIKVRGRINTPSKWCAYWSASENERRLGVDGAIWRIADNKELQEQAFELLAKHSGLNPMWKSYERVTYLNRHADVMKMLNNAIEELGI